MIKISFCATCKNRLWQLVETMPSNMSAVLGADDVDMVLLNYHSDDQLDQYVLDCFSSELKSGKLKYFKLGTERQYFDMSYAKNVVHRLATGQVLFNLDADNYIGEIIPELRVLAVNELLLPLHVTGTDTARFGRIGLHKSAFHSLRGYNEKITGMGNDDSDLTSRAVSQGLKPVRSSDKSVPVPNSLHQKYLFSDPDRFNVYESHKIPVNLHGYGNAVVSDLQGNIITLEPN